MDLLVYCGGDGTTRDIQKAIGIKLPAVGVPTGVKMHSALFAVSPKAAARVAIQYLCGVDYLCEKLKSWISMNKPSAKDTFQPNCMASCLAPLSRI